MWLWRLARNTLVLMGALVFLLFLILSDDSDAGSWSGAAGKNPRHGL